MKEIFSEYRVLGQWNILYIEASHRIWASRGNALYFSDDLGESFVFRASFNVTPGKRILAIWRPLARLMRYGFLELLPLPDGALVGAVRGQIVHCSRESNTFYPVLQRPGRTMKLVRTPEGILYAGEYFYNKKRVPVHIFSSTDGGKTWDVIYTFPAGAIRHVHDLIYDPYRKGILILTGDWDHESKVLLAFDHFRDVKVVAEGSQAVRSVGTLPVLNGFYLATDTPFEQNYVQFLDEHGNLTRRCPISGSCLYAASVGAWKFFSSAVEPSTVNKDRCATLYGTQDGCEWHVVGKWKADHWSAPRGFQAALFQMARVVLPEGENTSGYVFATTVGTKKTDGVLHRWRLP